MYCRVYAERFWTVYCSNVGDQEIGRRGLHSPHGLERGTRRTNWTSRGRLISLYPRCTGRKQKVLVFKSKNIL